MTTETTPRARRGRTPQHTLTGTGALLRLTLRRDRLRLTLWVLGIGLMAVYFANAVQALVSDESELDNLAGMFADPVGRLMTGPAFGMDAPTFERFFSAGYVLFLYLLVALMSVFTVVRHTRAEEQSRRAELVRANVVGRHATLTAALVAVTLANLAAGALIALGAISGGFDVAGSALVAASGVGVGLFFAGTAAVSSQLSASSRAASAMAGGAIAAAYLIRMGGDMARVGGSSLSWFSPLGWSQQTAPYVENHWWPLALLAGFAMVLAGLGYWLSTQRDVEASLVPPRLGRSAAKPSLGTPVGIAARTLRGGLRGWGLALVLCGLLFGSYAQTLIDAADDLPEELRQVFSGDSLMLGYLAYMTLFLALFVAAAGVSAIQVLRGEEVRGRAEFAMSAPVGRARWLGAHLVVLLGGLAVILAAVGIATAAGAVLVLSDGGNYVADLVLASVHQAPTVLAVVGIVVALFGWMPRAAVPVGWVIVGYAAVMTNFGRILDVPNSFHDANVFGYLAQYPVEDISWAPILGLSAVGVGGIVLGLAGWSRREVNRI